MHWYQGDTNLQYPTTEDTGTVEGPAVGQGYHGLSNLGNERPQYQSNPGIWRYNPDGYQEPSVNRMALGEQEVGRIRATFPPVQHPTSDVFQPTLQQSRLDGRSALPYGTEQHCFPMGYESIPGWQPLTTEASLSTRSRILDVPLEEANVHVPDRWLYENESVDVDRDDDMASEMSLDLEDFLRECNVGPQSMEPSASSRYETVLHERQPWSSLNASDNYSRQTNLYSDVHRLSDRIEVPGTDRSTTTTQTIASSYVVVDKTSSVSSFSQETQEDLADSAVTLRLQHRQSCVGDDVRGDGTNLIQVKPDLPLQTEGGASQHLVPSLANLSLL